MKLSNSCFVVNLLTHSMVEWFGDWQLENDLRPRVPEFKSSHEHNIE